MRDSGTVSGRRMRLAALQGPAARLWGVLGGAERERIPQKSHVERFNLLAPRQASSRVRFESPQGSHHQLANLAHEPSRHALAVIGVCGKGGGVTFARRRRAAFAALERASAVVVTVNEVVMIPIIIHKQIRVVILAFAP